MVYVLYSVMSKYLPVFHHVVLFRYVAYLSYLRLLVFQGVQAPVQGVLQLFLEIR